MAWKVAWDEAEDKALGLMGIYKEDPLGKNYREIERARMQMGNTGEIEERTRSLTEEREMRYFAALLAARAAEQVGCAYRKLAAEIKAEVGKTPVEW